MSSDNEIRINEALTLHRKGSVAEAKAVYESVLRQDAQNANALGLLGIVAIQEGDRSKAEMHWARSLALPSKPAIYIRNLNNLAVTLLEDGRDAEAIELLGRTDIPDWAGPPPPDERELKSIISLILCQLRLGLSKKARTLLESISQYLAGNNDTLRLLAQLRLDDEDYGSALDALKTIEADDDLWILTARVMCATKVSPREELRTHRDRLFQFASVYVGEKFTDQRKTILVLNPADNVVATPSAFDLHFHSNYVTQIADRLQDIFNFTSVFADSPYVKKDELKPHLILNNIVNGEVLSGAGGKTANDALADFVASFDKPVINHPLRAAMTTRQRNASSLKDLENVVIPKTIRFIADDKQMDFQSRRLAEKLDYPLIIRTTTFQSGIGMVKIDNPDQLREELSIRNRQEIYAHDFIENRTEDGFYRKFRAGVVGDKVIPHWVDFSDNWNVHGRVLPERKAFYRDRRYLRDVEKELMTVPNDTLSVNVLRTLENIRKKVPLDIFGIDFDVMADGRVLFFEANASMLLFDTLGPEYVDIHRYAEPSRRLQAEIAEFLQRKISIAG